MSLLEKQGVEFVHHYAPLHYLPFIARSGSLLSKPTLKALGFAPNHLRSMSSKQDQARGFGDYAFLTLDTKARILKAKLDAGFPHIGIRVPAAVFDKISYMLCRYNVAMTRYLRRPGCKGFPESNTNGKYYRGHQIPVAKSDADKNAMLGKHLSLGTMIEVLIEGDLKLPSSTQIVCFSKADAILASQTLKALNVPWAVVLEKPPGPYNRKKTHVAAVEAFVDMALADPQWRGNGLEFDRV